MVDNILEEIRVCSKCGTKTFCDYCPKCGSKMPASRSMNRSIFSRTDFDSYRRRQASSHNGTTQKMIRQVPGKAPTKQTKITAQQTSFDGLKMIAYVIVVIVIIALMFVSNFSIEQFFE